MIDNGCKDTEYRQKTDFWLKRIKDVTHVCFHKGYSNTTITYAIEDIRITRDQIEISF